MGIFFKENFSTSSKWNLIIENKTVKYSDSVIKELNKTKLLWREQEIPVKLMEESKKYKQN